MTYQRYDPPLTEAILDLVLEGKTNAQIWEIIQKRYDMPNDKKWYVSWYRGHLRRKGRLVEDTVQNNRTTRVVYE